MESKQITIFSANTVPIIIEDQSSENLNVYSQELTKLLESNNVSILHTTSGSLIIRPNVISAIIVSEDDDGVSVKMKQPEMFQKNRNKPDKIKKETIVDKTQDIIKD